MTLQVGLEVVRPGVSVSFCFLAAQGLYLPDMQGYAGVYAEALNLQRSLLHSSRYQTGNDRWIVGAWEDDTTHALDAFGNPSPAPYSGDISTKAGSIKANLTNLSRVMKNCVEFDPNSAMLFSSCSPDIYTHKCS